MEIDLHIEHANFKKSNSYQANLCFLLSKFKFMQFTGYIQSFLQQNFKKIF